MKIAYPIIFAVGLIGNFLNFYIFTRTRLKGLSTVRSLAYLSLVDAVYILIGIPHIILIIYQDYNLRDHSHFACSWHSFLTIYLSHLSSNHSLYYASLHSRLNIFNLTELDIN